MKSLLLGAVMLIAQDCVAQFVFTKKVNPSRLQSDLRAAGFNVQGILCQGGPGTIPRCQIQWAVGGETKDPATLIAAHVYRDWDAERASALSEIRSLHLKFKAGTITPVEKDRLLLLLVDLLVGGE